MNSSKEAQRKARKYFRKAFRKSEDENVEALSLLLNDEHLKRMLGLYDKLRNSPIQQMRQSHLNGDEYPIKIDDPSLAMNAIQTLLSDMYDQVMENPYFCNMANELCDTLQAPYFKSLMEAHDMVLRADYAPQITIQEDQSVYGPLKSHGSDQYIGGDAQSAGSSLNRDGTLQDISPLADSEYGGVPLKMIGIKKIPGEELGITVTERRFHNGQFYESEVVVERIMSGSRIDRQGLLYPGDVVREVNGTPIDTAESLQKTMRESKGTITLKVFPAPREKNPETQVFLKAFFSYNPAFDQLIPCQEAGLEFSAGDILQVTDQSDSLWWQARKFDQPEARAGLIPSWQLEERRRVFFKSQRDKNEITFKMFGVGIGRRKKKEKMTFTVNDAASFQENDVVVYEEVARLPGFQRKVVCLVGPPFVGRRTLKRMLIRAHPDFYTSPKAHTSRPMRDYEEEGNQYIFESREQMEADSYAGKYVELGEFGGHLYGTKLDTIRQCCKEGKSCILDVSITALLKSHLRTAEFMPYVVFVAAPSVDCMKAMYEYGRSMRFTEKYKRDEDLRKAVDESVRMERQYRHLFDYIIVNDNMDVAYDLLNEHLEGLLTKPQWVPIKWVY